MPAPVHQGTTHKGKLAYSIGPGQNANGVKKQNINIFFVFQWIQVACGTESFQVQFPEQDGAPARIPGRNDKFKCWITLSCLNNARITMDSSPGWVEPAIIIR